jgi:hypothetical protein
MPTDRPPLLAKLMPAFVVRSCCVQRFSRSESLLFLSSSSSFIFTRAEWTPFQTRYFSGNVVVPEIELETSEFVGRNCGQYTTEALQTEVTRPPYWFYGWWQSVKWNRVLPTDGQYFAELHMIAAADSGCAVWRLKR